MRSWSQDPRFLWKEGMKVTELWGWSAGWDISMSTHIPQDDGRSQVAKRKWARDVNAWWMWVSDLAVGFSREGWVQGFGWCNGCWTGLTRGGLSLWGRENNDRKVRGRSWQNDWLCFSHPACGWGRMTGLLQVARRLRIPSLCCTLRIPTFTSPAWRSPLSSRIRYSTTYLTLLLGEQIQFK